MTTTRMKSHHCVDRPEDTVRHTVEVRGTAWAECRRVHLKAIGGGEKEAESKLVRLLIQSAASRFRRRSPATVGVGLRPVSSG